MTLKTKNPINVLAAREAHLEYKEDEMHCDSFKKYQKANNFGSGLTTFPVYSPKPGTKVKKWGEDLQLETKETPTTPTSPVFNRR